MTTIPMALRVQGLARAFSGVQAVNGLSFDVAMGSVTGLIGPNGCGKSTSIDCISGFQRADAGRVFLGEVELTGLSPHRIAQLGLMRTFQNVQLYDELTVLENLLVAKQAFDGVTWIDVFLNRRNLRQAEAMATEHAQALVAAVELTRHAETPAGILSYGQKKLVALAASLMSRPQVVVLDEPLAGVNPTMISNIEHIIARLNRAGQTFLIVEHNMNFVMQRCHRVIVMEAGEMLVDGPPSVIREDARVINAYLGKVGHEVDHV